MDLIGASVRFWKRNVEVYEVNNEHFQIVIFTYQILIEFVNTQETASGGSSEDTDSAALPSPFQGIVENLSFLNFEPDQYLPPACTIYPMNYSTSMYCFTLIPLGLLFVSCLYELAQNYLHTKKEATARIGRVCVPGTNWKVIPAVVGTQRADKDKSLRMFVPLMTFLLPMIATEIGNCFICMSYMDGDGNEQSYVLVDHRVSCDSKLFKTTRLYALIMREYGVVRKYNTQRMWQNADPYPFSSFGLSYRGTPWCLHYYAQGATQGKWCRLMQWHIASDSFAIPNPLPR